MELGKLINHDIIIRPSANKGFIINVGCGEFTANDESMLLNCLGAYLSDPEKWEKEYNKKFGSEPAVPRSTPSEVPQPQSAVRATGGIRERIATAAQENADTEERR